MRANLKGIRHPSTYTVRARTLFLYSPFFLPFRINAILGDPGAVSRVDKMFVVKVYCEIETSSSSTAPGSPSMNKRLPHSLRSADVFPVVASLPPKINQLIFGGTKATTGNTSALRTLPATQLRVAYSPKPLFLI